MHRMKENLNTIVETDDVRTFFLSENEKPKNFDENLFSFSTWNFRRDFDASTPERCCADSIVSNCFCCWSRSKWNIVAIDRSAWRSAKNLRSTLNSIDPKLKKNSLRNETKKFSLSDESFVDGWTDLERSVRKFRCRAIDLDRKRFAKFSRHSACSIKWRRSARVNSPEDSDSFPTNTKSDLTKKKQTTKHDSTRQVFSSIEPETILFPSRNSLCKVALKTSQMTMLPELSTAANFSVYGSSRLW